MMQSMGQMMPGMPGMAGGRRQQPKQQAKKGKGGKKVSGNPAKRAAAEKAKANPVLAAERPPAEMPTAAETQAAMKDFTLPPDLQQMLNQQNKGPR